MLLVFQGTQTEIEPSEKETPAFLRCCEICGPKFTDASFGTNPEGKVGVFQFEHDDFHSEETQKALVALTHQFENQVCHVCDKLLPCDPDLISPKDFATKVLRMHPDGDNILSTCESCSTLGLCPCCNEDDES